MLCNISEHESVRLALSGASAAPVLISLLGSHIDEIQSRAAIVLSDMACVDDNQAVIASLGGIPPLVALLESELEDVLVNATNAVRVMCTGNDNNQTLVAECGALDPLVEFLGVSLFNSIDKSRALFLFVTRFQVSSDILRSAAAAAIAAITAGHVANQNRIVDVGAAV